MKILIVTVAGISSRFSESLGKTCLKCLYYENIFEESLLYRMLHQNDNFDFYVIVGGFQYEKLERAIQEHFAAYKEKLILLKNSHYMDYGSGYSLYLALKHIKDWEFQEVLFAEGDLYIDSESFQKIYESSANVITRNQEEIWASKAVAYYFDLEEHIHYIYDTAHGALEIPESFLGIFNSGQIWKFIDAEHLRKTFSSSTEKEWQGTNLVFIQNYFGVLSRNDYEIILCNEWINCNTLSDYKKIPAI